VTIFDYLETLVLDDLKLFFVRSGAVKPCFDTITQNVFFLQMQSVFHVLLPFFPYVTADVVSVPLFFCFLTCP
jgi:hypothetical protein